MSQIGQGALCLLQDTSGPFLSSACVEAELLKAGEFLTSSIKSRFIGCRNSYTGEKYTYLQAQLGSWRVFNLFHKPNYTVIAQLPQCR